MRKKRVLFVTVTTVTVICVRLCSLPRSVRLCLYYEKLLEPRSLTVPPTTVTVFVMSENLVMFVLVLETQTPARQEI